MRFQKLFYPIKTKSFSRKSIFFFLICIRVISFYGQSCTFNSLKQFSTSDNLPHNGTTTIFEDSDGFIWIGTYDGLNKYDGYSFKKYRNRQRAEILVNNRILSLNEDVNKKLWIGTENGINVLDLTSDKIITVFKSKRSDEHIHGVKKIVFGNNGTVFCLMENGILLEFDKNYKHIGSHQPQAIPSNQVDFRDINKVSENEYLISSSIGLLLFDVVTKKFKVVLADNVRSCFGILKVGRSHFYVVKSHGIAELSYKGEFKFIKTLFKEKRYKCIGLDTNNTLWLGGVSNISKVSGFCPDALEKDLKICNLESDSNEVYVSSINTNIKKSCWVTTYNKGVYQFETSKNPFKNYNKNYYEDYGIETNTVVGLTPYKENQVFISTYFGKISLFDVSKKKFLPFPFKKPSDRTEFKGRIFKDSRNNIWFSPRGFQMGLFVKKSGEDTFKPVLSKSLPAFNNALIRLITEDKYGFIWVADKKDVYRLHIDEKSNIKSIESLNKVLSNSSKVSLIRYIYCDPLYDFIWLGSETKGLYRFKISKDDFLKEIDLKNYYSSNDKSTIPSNYISHIIRDNQNGLWLAADQGGICNVLNEAGIPKFVTYTEKDGLINNGVKRIECDAENNLWFSTNAGINKFNIKKKQFRKYQKDDGLPFLQFSFASAKMSNGSLVFGGSEGFTYFDPKDIKKTNEVPNIQFGDFKLFNKVIAPGDTIDGKVLLKKKVSLLEKIELNHNQNVFSIEVSSLHFKSPKNHFLKHKLSPIDKDWVLNPSSNNTIYYSGLPPGEYRFKVMASNSDNIWSAPKTLEIIIKPHFLRTKWAYILYVLLAMGLLAFGVLLTLRFYKLQHKLEIEKLEKKQESELSDEKLRFFANISHEFRTPLTLITGPLELLLEKFKSDKFIVDYLRLVGRQSKKILELVEQAHDFRKVEKELLPLHVSKFNFTNFINQLILDFDYLATKNGKKIILENPDCIIHIVGDKSKIEKVLNNLINNAFKFTASKDCIKVSFYKKENRLVCSVEDSGRGISTEDLPYVFDRFYQSKEDYVSGGSGIGLAFSKKLIELHQGEIFVESKIGEGAKFTFEIPVGNIDSLDVKEEKLEEIFKEEMANDNSLEFFEEEYNLSEIVIDDNLKRSQLFIVEDNNEMRFFLRDIFTDFFDIKIFANGKECIDALEEDLPDLIISDVMMPVMTGVELCEQIKTDIRTSHIPIILLTAVSTMEDRLKGLGVGADVYVSKPFQVKNLVLQSIMLLKNREILRERFQQNFSSNTIKTQDNHFDKVFIDKLFVLINENLSDSDLDVNFLSKELCISRSHFFQKVKALTNQTPYELLKNYRLQKAAEMLSLGNSQVSEVCLEMGFKSMSYFSRAFKNKFGIAPSKYNK